jgi:DNA-binding NarL/FixJ family response regulator
MDAVRVLVVEDEPLYRDLLVHALVDRIPGVTVVNDVATAEEALATIGSDDVDVLLTDIDLGSGMTGTQLGVEMRRKTTTRGVVLLSNLALPTVLQTIPVEAQGGWSYLLKTSVSNIDQLGRAIEAASAGEVLFDEVLVNDLEVITSGPMGQLTPRQIDVLSRMARGWSNRRIADDLHLTVRTVESIASNIITVLDILHADDGLNPRVAAVLIYMQNSTPRRPPRLN